MHWYIFFFYFFFKFWIYSSAYQVDLNICYSGIYLPWSRRTSLMTSRAFQGLLFNNRAEIALLFLENVCSICTFWWKRSYFDLDVVKIDVSVLLLFLGNKSTDPRKWQMWLQHAWSSEKMFLFSWVFLVPDFFILLTKIYVNFLFGGLLT